MTADEVPATLRGSYDDPENWEPWIAYIRVSTWKEEKISPELQESAIRAWAKRTRRRIIDVVTDPDATGRNFKRKIMVCIHRVEAREAYGIAVWKFSRFGRHDHGIAINLARLENAGGQLASATEDVDVSTAVGRFNRGILFKLAVFESERAGEMWKDTHQWRRAHGLPATGGKRMGYIWHPRRIPDPNSPGRWIIQDERYQIEESARPHIEALYDRKIGLSTGVPEGYGSLSGWLNRLGYRTGTGAMLQANTLRAYMLAGFAAGLLRVHDPSCGCEYSANGSTCTNWIHIDGAHEGIITPETFERFQEHAQSRRKMPVRARSPKYTLTGLVRCGECRGEGGITSVKRAAGRVYGYAYQCSTRSRSGGTVCSSGMWIHRYVVEDEVLAWLRRKVADDIDAAPATPIETPTWDGERERERAARERDRLQAEHTQIEGALARLAADKALKPTSYPAGTFEAAQGHLLRQHQEIKEALEAAAAVAAAPRRADYAPIAGRLVELWEVMSDAERNFLLRKVVRRVVCTRGAMGTKGVAGSGQTRVAVHAVWDPDPWAAES
ncbi:recombinase family protein [Streptomyces sp. LE64]|uniref:recombinase family protein n=1 Tax=Streptomyces sp. LE64 TaxID=3448653 RepID=UPI0040418EC6